MVKKKSESYEIDQSGKIENTSKDTILCLANGSWDAVIIKARTKRQIQEIFRRNGQIRNYVLFTFSILLAVLIKRNNKLGQVMIDTEYTGKDPIIKNITLEVLKNEQFIPDMHFGFVGKLSSAHLLGKEIARGRKKASVILNEEQIIELLKKTEVGSQLKDA